MKPIRYPTLTAALTETEGGKERAPDREIPESDIFSAAAGTFPAPVPGPRIMRYPATILSAYHGDADGFLRNKLAGLEPTWRVPKARPDEGEPAVDDIPAEADSDDTGSAATFGSAGHAVLELMAREAWKGETRSTVRAACEDYDVGEAEYAELARRIENALPVMRDRLENAGELRAEWPFAITIPDDTGALIVDGTIDLLFRDGQGAWRVIDYKFSDDSPADLMTKYALQLNLYREAVARRAGDINIVAPSCIVAIGKDSTRVIEMPADTQVLQKTLEAAKGLHAISEQR